MKPIFITFRLASLLGYLLFSSSCTRTLNEPIPPVNNSEIVIDAEQKNIAFTIEIADTPTKRNLGLMGRKTLPSNHGMLFIFERMARHSFWMKNTLIPLDLIFFDDNFAVVGVIENTEPLSLRMLSIDKDARYVLEVIAGTVKKYGINSTSRAHLTSE